MADLSKIKLNGTEYNLKDAEARQLVSDLEDSIPEVPSVLSELVNDVGYITSYTETDPTVPSWAKASTKPTYTASEVGAVPASVSSFGGTGTITNAANIITISEGDSGGMGSASLVMNGSSVVLTSTKDFNNSSIKLKTNNVENIVLSEGQTTITGVVTPTSNTMAANKKYVDDSVSAISVPTKTSDLTNDSGYITSYTETDPIFTASAAAGISSTDISNWNAKSNFSGSYNDLSNKPTIPNVTSTYDATSTDAMNGVAISGALSSCVPEAVTNEEVITMMAALGYAVPVTDENDDPLTNNDSQILG